MFSFITNALHLHRKEYCAMDKIELIGTFITSIAAILGGVWFIINRAFKAGEKNGKIMEIDKRTCNAKCELHDNDISLLKQDLKEIKTDIIAIKSLLVMKHKNAADIFSVKNSPRKLNENGERLFSDIEGDKFLLSNKAFFFSKIDELSPKTALDVENAANFVCTSNIDNEIFNGLKNFVYNSPTYTLKDAEGKERLYDISMSDICFVLSLPLRDMYLSEHNEIPIE